MNQIIRLERINKYQHDIRNRNFILILFLEYLAINLYLTISNQRQSE